MKCEHTDYAGVFGAMDGEGPVRCHRDAVSRGLCANHGGARDIVQAGLIPDTSGFSTEQVIDAQRRADTRTAQHEVEIKLSELFSDKELKRPERCVLRLVTQMLTENTGGNLTTRALLIVKERP